MIMHSSYFCSVSEGYLLCLILSIQPVPSSFWRNFGKYVNYIVHFYLRNGTIYEGSCSKDLCIFNVPIDLYVDLDLSETDNLLFTYVGDGNFLMMIFDKFGYEKCLTGGSNASGQCYSFL